MKTQNAPLPLHAANTKKNHEEIVDECINRLINSPSTEPLDKIFSRVVNALWVRSSHTLSEITLTAIFERALYTSKEQFQTLHSFGFQRTDGANKEISTTKETHDRPQLIAGFRYLLVTILTLIGNITANILINGLYHELQTFSLQSAKADPLSFGFTATEDSEQIANKPSGKRERSENTMDRNAAFRRLKTHISNLDAILGGGLPEGSITIIAGPPGTGKTILSQQIIFRNASPDKPAIFFQTLSEPTAKTLKYLSQFKFYDPTKLEDGSIEFIDLGGLLKIKGIQEGIDMLMEHVKRVKPAFVVIDSFKVFEDLIHSAEDLRKFSYQIAINLMAWECTALLLGEFDTVAMETNPLFSIVDGLIKSKIRRESGEEQRFLQVVKMRGTDHSRDEHQVTITETGLAVYAPRLTIRREQELARTGTGKRTGPMRAKLGISRIDDLLGEGVPAGSSLIISGVAGTGKTLLSLEFLYRGAHEFGEKGIYFSFEETEDRLRAEARGMGWHIDELIDSGMIEIIFIPQPDIVVEKHLLMMDDRINKLKAKRIAIDSVSLFVHKLTDSQIVREKIFQLATLVQKAQGIGFFVTDIPYGANTLSRFGVEETVVDGVILLTSSEREYGRERFIEIYKLRNTAHLNGRNKMEITGNGITIIPRDKLVIHAGGSSERLQKKKGPKKAA